MRRRKRVCEEVEDKMKTLLFNLIFFVKKGAIWELIER
jgi:hypothetical protein